MFKKKIAAVLAAVVAFSSSAALAADVSVKLNGVEMELGTTAYIKNDRTMVPLRGVFEAVGATVSWDGETKTAMIAQQNGEDIKFIFLQIGSDKAFVNSEEKVLEAAPEISNDYTMVPLHFIMEELGTDVQWDGETYTVNITANEAE
ncbi:MAG: copper amine oxidase N-terminal domain-containing protein [Clostridia bacterium]|nr:copper amine oxidase N-terminal domain-containing protein [Clostridia bacterium]